MNDEMLEKVVQEYECKMKKDKPTFELTPFEKLLIKQGIIYGYEYKTNELKK